MNATSTKHGYGKFLKQARIRAALTQDDLANQLGISTGAISRYEAGTLAPGKITKIRLAEILNIPQQMLDLQPDTADATLPAIVAIWDQLSANQRIRVVQFMANLAAENIAEDT